jgi:hypothetical protein
MKLPPSEAPTGNFEFTVSTWFNGVYYPVDTMTKGQLFQATRAAFGFGSIVTDSTLANKVTSYTFTLQNNNPILRNGYIVIGVPIEVTFPITPKCESFINF